MSDVSSIVSNAEVVIGLLAVGFILYQWNKPSALLNFVEGSAPVQAYNQFNQEVLDATQGTINAQQILSLIANPLTFVTSLPEIYEALWNLTPDQILALGDTITRWDNTLIDGFYHIFGIDHRPQVDYDNKPWLGRHPHYTGGPTPFNPGTHVPHGPQGPPTPTTPPSNQNNTTQYSGATQGTQGPSPPPPPPQQTEIHAPHPLHGQYDI